MRKQIPLVQDIKDHYDIAGFTYTSNLVPQMKNVYVERYDDPIDHSQKIEVIQRPGLTTSTWNVPGTTPPGSSPVVAAVNLDPTPGAGTPFVIYADGTQAGQSFYWGTVQKAAAVFDASVWWDIAQLAGSTSSLYGDYVLAVTNGTGGAVGQSSFLVDGTGTLAAISDADFPHSVTKTNFLAMDGFTFICTISGTKLHNSIQNQPGAWEATGYINVNLYPGKAVRLMRIRNLLAVFKSNSIEFFENKGNPTPGSPLEPRPELAKRYGAIDTSFFAEVDDGIVFAGRSPSKKPGIYKLRSSDLEIEEISTPFISQLLALDNSGAGDGVGNTPFSSSRGSKRKMGVLPLRNKKLVLVPLMINHASGGAASSNYGTFVYDPDLKTWYLWTTIQSATEKAFPTQITRTALTTGNPIRLTGFDTGDTWFSFEDHTFDDNSAAIDVKLVTNNLDFGTFRRKFMSSLELGYAFDKTSGAEAAIVSMRYSDDGGINYSTAVSKSLATGTYGRLVWRKLGQFRTRRFVFSKSGPCPFRFTLAEADLMAADDDID
jgi:hypothetical protein